MFGRMKLIRMIFHGMTHNIIMITRMISSKVILNKMIFIRSAISINTLGLRYMILKHNIYRMTPSRMAFSRMTFNIIDGNYQNGISIMLLRQTVNKYSAMIEICSYETLSTLINVHPHKSACASSPF